MIKSFDVILAFGLAVLATTASAAPFIYTYHIDNQGGSLIGVPLSAATVRLRVFADSNTLASQTVFGSAGECVTGTSADVSVNGANPVSITQQMYVCQTNSGLYLGVYPDLTGNTTRAHVDATVAGVSLTATGGPYVIPLNSSHNGGSLTVSGGTFVFGTSYTNTAASFFSVAVATAVPMMSHMTMVLLGFMLVGCAVFYIQRRRMTISAI